MQNAYHYYLKRVTTLQTTKVNSLLLLHSLIHVRKTQSLYDCKADLLSFRLHITGARKDLRNEEGKLPYDMAVKYPEAAKQLKVTVVPPQYSADYGDEEDSD